MISMEEFKKFNLRIGKVVKTEKGIEIECEDKKFLCSNNIPVDVNDNVVILIGDDEMRLIVAGNTPIVADEKIGSGAKIR